jgi:hypothetical protein
MSLKIIPTRFETLAYANIIPGLWRFVDISEGMPKEFGQIRAVGPHYKTKIELLTDADRYAKDAWGY